MAPFLNLFCCLKQNIIIFPLYSIYLSPRVSFLFCVLRGFHPPEFRLNASLFLDESWMNY